MFVQSQLILEATLTVHLGGCKEKYPTKLVRNQRSLYVDGVILGDNNIPELKQLQATIIKILGEANSNNTNSIPTLKS